MLESTRDNFDETFEDLWDEERAREVLESVGDQLVSKVRSRTPRSSKNKEHLQDNWIKKMLRRKGLLTLLVGARIPQASHAHLVEDGFQHASGKEIPGQKMLSSSAQAMDSTVHKKVAEEI